MDGEEWKIRELKRELKRLERRVEKLEGRAFPKPRGGREPVEPSRTELSFMNRLLQFRGPRYERGDLKGAVAYAGAVHFNERQYLWIKDRGLPEVMEYEFDSLAGLLSTLSSLPRLVMLRTLLQGPRSSRELQQALGISSAGQLYHHLKDLLAAGLVVQSRRGLYQVPGGKAVPVLAILAAAMDLTESGAGGSGIQDTSNQDSGPEQKSWPRSKGGRRKKTQPAGA